MTLVWLYLLTFAVFLAIDYVGLSYLIRPVFERDIGHLLLDDLRIVPAFFFYAFYIFCVIWFVGAPALSEGKSLLWVFGSAALLGAMAYGTYEFTSLAVMKDWTWSMVAIDLVWGTVLTGLAMTVGVVIVRAFV